LEYVENPLGTFMGTHSEPKNFKKSNRLPKKRAPFEDTPHSFSSQKKSTF
jgi:hypothetical protein